MNINNILTTVAYYGFTTPTVKGLTSWIASFINLFPSIVLGVVIFTIALKLITFPLDYYSRASMRRNTLKMEQMRPQLEKLQKQYANDKQKYNQKMMALYKKNGYSMFGACLPSILTLVFFIIVLTAFNNYSTYQNVKYLYNMNTAYNSVVDEGINDITVGETKLIYHDKEGKFVIDDEAIKAYYDEHGNPEGLEVTYYTNEAGSFVKYATPGNYITITKEIIDHEADKTEYKLETTMEVDFALLLQTKVPGEEKTYGDLYNEFKALPENAEKAEDILQSDFITDYRQYKSAEKYRDETESFLWVKNVWMPDTPMQHPVYKDYKTFNSKYKLSTGDEQWYANLTAKLDREKGQANGYFILVILTAGTSLLLQLVSMKSQKAQMELQSVDGQGMQTQKIMMWMMPIMMAVFAFMYTAAFSLYIITSTLTSLASTLLINKVVDVKFKKMLEKEENDTVYKKVRVVEPEETGKKNKGKNKKK